LWIPYENSSLLIKTDCSKPTLVDYGVENFIEYSKPKLFLMDSNSEFVAIPKLVATS
jgi:hypothetical protein